MNWGFAPSTKRGGWQMVWASSEYADVSAVTYQSQDYDVLADIMITLIKRCADSIMSYGINTGRIEEASENMQEWVGQSGEKAVPNTITPKFGRVGFEIIEKVADMGDQDVFSGMTLLCRIEDVKKRGVEVSDKLIMSATKPCLEFHYWDSTEEYFGEFAMIQRL